MHVPKGATTVTTKYGTLHVTPETAREFQAVTADDAPLTIFGIEYALRVHVEWNPQIGCQSPGWRVNHSWCERQDREWHHQGKNDLTDGAARIIRHGDLADDLIAHVDARAGAGDHWGAEADRIRHEIGVLRDARQKLDCQIQNLGYAKLDAKKLATGIGGPQNRKEYTCKCERYDNGMQKHREPDVERCVLCCFG